MCDQESALLAAIAANPTSTLHRGVYADWLDDEGRHDEADAVRGTKDKWPGYYTYDHGQWFWCKDYHGPSVALHCLLDNVTWDHLLTGVLVGPFRDYTSFTAALLDLIRAWRGAPSTGARC